LLASVLSSAISGVDAFPVEVEVDIGGGAPSFRMVGLAEGAVREAFDRIKSALRNSGYEFPHSKITINLAPADMRKEGSAFDLPMALGILAGSGALQKRERIRRYLVLGELALDGRVKGIKGALPSAILARAQSFSGILLPRENAPEASVVGEGVAVFGVDTLQEAFEFFEELRELEPCTINLNEMFENASRYADDFSEVKGQEQAKRALEVAAAGGHNVLIHKRGGQQIPPRFCEARSEHFGL
jgi:magnesium chelatase family protein